MNSDLNKQAQAHFKESYKVTKLHFQGKQNHITHKPVSTIC